MADDAAPVASYAAGQIAIQTLLTVLINLYIAECDDREQARAEIIGVAEEIITGASAPDLPAAEQKATREQAKSLVRDLISGGAVN